MLTTVTAGRPATTADLGFIPSLGLRADILRSHQMRTAWDDMVVAALDFDTNRYERAKACFNLAKEG